MTVLDSTNRVDSRGGVRLPPLLLYPLNMAEVIGVLSAVIALVETSIKIYDSAQKICDGLSILESKMTVLDSTNRVDSRGGVRLPPQDLKNQPSTRVPVEAPGSSRA
jgi:hypothetical protein